ncbi:MAG TPA: polyprenyl synthetase family protein [Deltaproteobacteria bacterium]|nr:polyprenyl synthetase family protein [Deltaproteobacteria bacterium]
MSELKQKIYSKIKADLADIELELSENLNPFLDLVSKTASHILFSGGKRLRPILTVLSAKLCGYSDHFAKRISTVFEYLHAATLLHDDLVDGASVRRGSPVAHSIWGNSTAVLVGDFLLARALSIASETRRPKVIKIISQITENMSQGEIHQLMRKGNIDLSESEYLEIITRKTAVLIQGSCRVGAILAKASEKNEKALSDYGFNLGLAFQMADDLLDYTANPVSLGKEIGADLKEGKLTLPVIRALGVANPEDQSQMKAIIQNEQFSAEEFRILVDMLNQYDGIKYTRKLAGERIDAAKAALSVFQPSEIRNLLNDIADYALEREV